MTKNLETADIIAKLVLSVLILVLYFARIIAGPFAVALVILSFFILTIHAARLVYRKLYSGKKREEPGI